MFEKGTSELLQAQDVATDVVNVRRSSVWPAGSRVLGGLAVIGGCCCDMAARGSSRTSARCILRGVTGVGLGKWKLTWSTAGRYFSAEAAWNFQPWAGLEAGPGIRRKRVLRRNRGNLSIIPMQSSRIAKRFASYSASGRKFFVGGNWKAK